MVSPSSLSLLLPAKSAGLQPVRGLEGSPFPSQSGSPGLGKRLSEHLPWENTLLGAGTEVRVLELASGTETGARAAVGGGGRRPFPEHVLLCSKGSLNLHL